MGKRYICPNCSKELANRHNLCRHKKKYCKWGDPNVSLRYNQLGEKQEHRCLEEIKPFDTNQNIQTCSPFPDITKPASNPKLSAVINAIVNNGEPTPVKTLPFSLKWITAEKTTTKSKKLKMKYVVNMFKENPP